MIQIQVDPTTCYPFKHLVWGMNNPIALYCEPLEVVADGPQ